MDQAMRDSMRAEILSKLAQSRAELQLLLDPPRNDSDSGEPGRAHDGAFPRSRTMQMLMTGKGLGTLGAVVSGLFIARPALALRLLKMLPASAVARTLLVKAFTSWRNKQG
jgi:hypothetical protein